MSKPLWQIAEEDFVSSFGTRKTAFVFQFHDARAAMGASQSRRVFTTKHPSDFLVTDKGVTYYAEVKSSIDATSFSLNNIKRSQWSAATRVVAAGGLYFFFLKSETLQAWFRVPAAFLLGVKEKSVKWSLLSPYQHDLQSHR